MANQSSLDHSKIRDYYDRVHHSDANVPARVSQHLRRLANCFRPWEGKRLLDIGCGQGMWLRAAADLGAVPVGVDISPVALDLCKRAVPQADLCCGPAEKLPFTEGEFDFISCLGAVEHFLNPEVALREMIRVAKPEAVVLLLVPNAGFLTRRLGLYSGTQQVNVCEEVRSLPGWHALFESVGLHICQRWRDLHVLSTSWICRGPWYGWPLRAGQALALPLWPLTWQYQVYHLCVVKK